jgi:L-2,4-diaminobutyric acid acetyltransferase
LRKPCIEDAGTIWKLIHNSPPLDINSLYSYLILCAHFADTSVVAESAEEICGYVSAYIRPGHINTLFIWQVVVETERHGQGIAKMMINTILRRQYSNTIQYLETTVNPSNTSSNALFDSIAKSLNTRCEKSILFSKKDFGNLAHEDEILYRIGPFDTQ